ncbi:M20 family peptidase [Sporolactobacillus sp. THM7-7]|nr:M20 family peptidase [Sporolactobacillus sp. THM7-7]
MGGVCFLKKSEQDSVAFLQDLLRIDSTNPPGDESILRDKIRQRALLLNLETEVQSVNKDRANLIVKLKGNGNKPSLIFCGHMDTVGVGRSRWTFDPFSGEISEGKMYGRGASDMKSGLAAMLEAMGRIRKNSRGHEFGDLILVATVGEEVDCLGAKHAVKTDVFDRAGAMVIAEPSNREVVITHKGALWLKITTYGKTSHASMPEYGINAVDGMSKIMALLNENFFSLDKKNKLLGRPTINIGTIRGGIQTNVVPDQCEMTVDIRTLPEMDHQQILSHLERKIDELGIRYKIDVLHDLAPLDTKPNNDFVKKAVSVNEQITGRKSSPQGINFYTDGSIICQHKAFPIVIYGPGERELAHQPNEFVEVDKYLQSIDFYVRLTEAYFQDV